MAVDDEELCRCVGSPPVKLMWALSLNVVHCMDCNLEVPAERLGLPPAAREAVDDFARTAAPIHELELASGDYEGWARSELLDLASPVNRLGFAACRAVDETRRCYYLIFQDHPADDFVPLTHCPLCRAELTPYTRRHLPQRVCERCRVAVFAG